MPIANPLINPRALQEEVFNQHLGINRLADRLSQPPGYFYTLRNCFVTKQNYVQQRNGTLKLTTTPLTGSPKIRKLFEYENNSGGRTIIGRGGTRWARFDGVNSWIDLDTGRASDAYGQACQFLGYLIMADGGKLRYSDASWSVANVDNTYLPANSSTCHTHNFRLVTNDDANPLMVYLSEVGILSFNTTAGHTGTTLDLSAVVPVGDKILGYSTYLSTYLVIWMRKHIVVYNVPTTNANIALQQVIKIGCISYNGVINPDSGDIMFPSESGYKSFVQSFNTTSILDVKDETALMGPYYRSAIATLSDARDISGVYYSGLNHSYFTFPFASAMEIWALSDDLKNITEGKGNVAGYFTEITAYSFLQTANRNLYFGDNAGNLWQMDTGTDDNGSAILMEAAKTALTFGASSNYKRLKEFEALFEATKTLTLTLTYDYSTTGLTSGALTKTATVTTQTSLWDVSLWDVSYWDASGDLLYRTRDLLGRGKLVNMKISHNTLGAQLRFPYWIMRFFMEGMD